MWFVNCFIHFLSPYLDYNSLGTEINFFYVSNFTIRVILRQYMLNQELLSCNIVLKA